MIISKTPLRISFTGGGSDLKSFYATHTGAVVSTTVDKYMYVTVNRRFDQSIRVSYTKTEIVDRLDDIQHTLVRETMRTVGVESGIEITTIADVPAGTGLGSSSSLTVGLLNALYAFKGCFRSAEQLAQEACQIEIEMLGKPIGKQDHYAAAYGGLNFIEFNRDETVFVNPIICANETKKELERSLLTFYTGYRGENDNLLAEQSRGMSDNPQKRAKMQQMVTLACRMRQAVCADDLTSFGRLLHENWELKKDMASSISNTFLDQCYQAALAAGAVGGKVLGAGGGGFLLLYCPEDRQAAVRSVLKEMNLREFLLRFEAQGSRIIYLGS